MSIIKSYRGKYEFNKIIGGIRVPNEVIGIDWSNEEDYSSVNAICSSCKTIIHKGEIISV